MMPDPKTIGAGTSIFFANFSVDETSQLLFMVTSVVFTVMKVREHIATMKKLKSNSQDIA